MHLPVALSAVSQAVQSIVAQEFGRTSTIIPNSVDCNKFRPGPLSCHPYSAVLTAPANEVYHSQIIILGLKLKLLSPTGRVASVAVGSVLLTSFSV